MGLIKNIIYNLSNTIFLKKSYKQSVFPYYHIVTNEKRAHIKYLYPFKNISQFRHDIKFLNENYGPANPSELFLDTSFSNNFLLTFDDGLREIYTEIFPILQEQNLKAIFFINPDFVDNKVGLYKHYISIILENLESKKFDENLLEEISIIMNFKYISNEEFIKKLLATEYKNRGKIEFILNLLNINIQKYLELHKLYISKEEIQEMIDAGHYFGGHTMSHPPLQDLSYLEKQKEIIDSIDWLKKNFNINYSLFAFPFSDKGISKKLLAALFEYDSNIRIFGNSGLKKDIDPRIIQRFSLENPYKKVDKQIVTENLYMYYNKLIGKYKIKRA